MSNKNKNTPAVDKTAGVNQEESRFAEAKAERGTVEGEKLFVEQQSEAEKVAAEKAEADKVAAEKAESDKVAAEKAEADKVAAEKAESDKAAAEKAEAHNSINATIIPSGIFIAENGDEFEFTVSSFTFQGKVYTKEEALSDHADVLEHLISVKSFILKKV